jgi:hypothetical protein
METLFNLPESLSPKLAWMRKHGVELHYSPPKPANYEAEIPKRPLPDGTPRTVKGSGITEMEALSALASKLGAPMWDEETLSTQTSHE